MKICNSQSNYFALLWSLTTTSSKVQKFDYIRVKK